MVRVSFTLCASAGKDTLVNANTLAANSFANMTSLFSGLTLDIGLSQDRQKWLRRTVLVDRFLRLLSRRAGDWAASP
jgi:hypothetical protein